MHKHVGFHARVNAGDRYQRRSQATNESHVGRELGNHIDEVLNRSRGVESIGLPPARRGYVRLGRDTRSHAEQPADAGAVTRQLVDDSVTCRLVLGNNFVRRHGLGLDNRAAPPRVRLTRYSLSLLTQMRGMWRFSGEAAGPNSSTPREREHPTESVWLPYQAATLPRIWWKLAAGGVSSPINRLTLA